MGTDAAAAAFFAEPAKLCRNTMQSAYPSIVRIVSAERQLNRYSWSKPWVCVKTSQHVTVQFDLPGSPLWLLTSILQRFLLITLFLPIYSLLIRMTDVSW